MEGQVVGKYIDPQIAKLTGALPADPAALTNLAAYRLTLDSPCLKAGMPIDSGGGRDFWGNPVPQDGRPAIGACEKP
ncbi:MAG: hypothetical protein A2Y77_07985 [Planctomycetes bacterium RBG_13_62_9]|nr:MAG: hypothetical protein A2Y77_07985 [Planctomycetes bacterium RBG_13_62_9]